ncbi:Laminin subunit alpha-2 [Mactra antiquata]
MFEMSETIRILKFIFLALICYTEARSVRRNRSACQGRSRIDIQSNDGVKIEPLSYSKVYIDSLAKPFHDGHTLRFEFRTQSSNATLFYAVRRNDEYDMVSCGINEGFLHFKIRCKSSYVDLTIPTRVDDGEWHKVKFQRRRKKGIIMLDDMEFFEQYYVGCGGFTSVNFGSTNPEHDNTLSIHELKDKDGQLNGCIRKLHITTGIEAPPHYTAVSECN